MKEQCFRNIPPRRGAGRKEKGPHWGGKTPQGKKRTARGGHLFGVGGKANSPAVIERLGKARGVDKLSLGEGKVNKAPRGFRESAAEKKGTRCARESRGYRGRKDKAQRKKNEARARRLDRHNGSPSLILNKSFNLNPRVAGKRTERNMGVPLKMQNEPGDSTRPAPLNTTNVEGTGPSCGEGHG